MYQQKHNLEIKQINELKQRIKQQIRENKLKRAEFIEKLKQQILDEWQKHKKLQHEQKYYLKHKLKKLTQQELKMFKQCLFDKLKEFKQRRQQIWQGQQQKQQQRQKYLNKLFNQYFEIEDSINDTYK